MCSCPAGLVYSSFNEYTASSGCPWLWACSRTLLLMPVADTRINAAPARTIDE